MHGEFLHGGVSLLGGALDGGAGFADVLAHALDGVAAGEHEGQGEVTVKAGDAWLLPPGIKHTVLDYSDDCENLEITVPAEFETVNVENVHDKKN